MALRRREFLLEYAALPLLGAPALSRSKVVFGTRIPIPPEEHPRLYLRSQHVPALAARISHPALKPAIDLIHAQSNRAPNLALEWAAVEYLMQPGERAGRAIVEDTLRLLRETAFVKRLDYARTTGRIMVTGAIVYDWLYPLLTADEKRAYVAELLRLAHTQECGYPPVKQGAVNGHSAEALLMRNMLSAGIAIYNEFPEMYELTAARIFREHIPARNWFYPGHAYHQGDSYGPGRFTWDCYALFIFDRLGAPGIFHPDQRWVPYHFLYSTRPDRQRLRAGDSYLHFTPKGQPWNEDLGTMLTASYYEDGMLMEQHNRQRSYHPDNGIFEFLWRNLEVQPHGPEKLPLSRYFGFPFGWMIARTSWGHDAAIVEMKVNKYNFVNHQHLDAGAFQIYHRGPLAIDSGLYQGSSGAYDSEHCRNYFWRTIAHNSMLVHDPKEDFGEPQFGNDGGQRIPNGRRETLTLEALLLKEHGYRTATTLGQGFGPQQLKPAYTYLQGDFTQAYSRKVRAFRRSFLFVNFEDAKVPGALIVFDRVVSASAEFRKYWLLHTMEEPRIEGATVRVDAPGEEGGRLWMNVLLPRTAALQAVGGPGKEYWVFGKNYENNPNPRHNANGSIESGAWRVELSPAEAAEEDHFLTVMQIAGRELERPLPVSPLRAQNREGCLIAGPTGYWAVLFRRDCQRSGDPVAFTVPQSANHVRVLICDLLPGKWTAAAPAEGATKEIVVPDSSGIAYFQGTPGIWRLARLAEA